MIVIWHVKIKKVSRGNFPLDTGRKLNVDKTL